MRLCIPDACSKPAAYSTACHICKAAEGTPHQQLFASCAVLCLSLLPHSSSDRCAMLCGPKFLLQCLPLLCMRSMLSHKRDGLCCACPQRECPLIVLCVATIPPNSAGLFASCAVLLRSVPGRGGLLSCPVLVDHFNSCLLCKVAANSHCLQCCAVLIKVHAVTACCAALCMSKCCIQCLPPVLCCTFQLYSMK